MPPATIRCITTSSRSTRVATPTRRRSGSSKLGRKEFAGRIPTILKLNNSDSLFSGEDPKPAVTGSVEDALKFGCAAVGFTIYPASM